MHDCNTVIIKNICFYEELLELNSEHVGAQKVAVMHLKSVGQKKKTEEEEEEEAGSVYAGQPGTV